MDVLRVVALNVLSGTAALRLGNVQAEMRNRTRLALEHDGSSLHGSARSTVPGQVPKKRHEAVQQVRRCANSREKTDAAGRTRDAAESLESHEGAARAERHHRHRDALAATLPQHRSDNATLDATLARDGELAQEDLGAHSAAQHTAHHERPQW